MPRHVFENKHTSVEYVKLRKKNDDFSDAQYKAPPVKVPVKSIVMAVVLFIGGTTLLVIGILLVTGYFDAKYGDRTWPLIVLGLIMFIPGFYHSRLALYAYQRYPGYSYEDIPDYDD